MNDFEKDQGGAGWESSGQPGEGVQRERMDSARDEIPSERTEESSRPEASGYRSSGAYRPPQTLGKDSAGEQAGQADGAGTGGAGGFGNGYSQGQNQGPPVGQGWRGAPYTPPYQTQNNPAPGPYSGGYGQGSYQGQNRSYYGQNQGYVQQGQYYQYSTNSAWQQPPPKQEKYEWKFEDYDKLDQKKEKKKRNRGLVVFTVALLCVLSVGLVGLAAYSLYTATIQNDEGLDGEETVIEESVGERQNPAGELEITAKPQAADTPSPEGKMTIPQVAKAVLPSVVGVIKYDNDQYYEIGGLGSGIIMSEDGYIITNAHVVAEGTGFKVQLYNGEPYDAELIGYDTLTDLAVLRIEAEGLIPAKFGDSHQIEVGETVVAIGNPAGLELAGSVTQGIVPAVSREVRHTNTMTYIQTDAAINPGNSGGALANEYGQVIGINSNKIVASGYEGIGFAIPISDAKPVIDDLITNGKVTGRVMLGITCRTVDEVDARNYGVQMGLSIDTVDAESDLANKGVLKGDILTHIDGERVYTLGDVRRLLDTKKPGDSATLTLYRRIGSREVTYDVTTRLMESK